MSRRWRYMDLFIACTYAHNQVSRQLPKLRSSFKMKKHMVFVPGCSVEVSHAYLSGSVKKLGYQKSKYIVRDVKKSLFLGVQDLGKQLSLKDRMLS